MKKFFSIILAVCLVAASMVCSFATEVTTLGNEDTGDSLVSTVTYTYSNPNALSCSNGEWWEVSVPATITCGVTAQVTATGEFSSDKTLWVTAPESITLSDGAQGQQNVDVTFNTICLTGSTGNEVITAAEVYVEVPEVTSGTWTGKITYTVTLLDAVQ